MRLDLASALAAVLVFTTITTASAQTTQPLPAWATLKTYSGTIVRVDAAARMVTTRNAAGETSVFEAPPALASAQLSTFAPGDPITVTFYEGVEVRKRAAGAAAVASSVDPATGLRTATVTLTGVDMAQRSLSFLGPRGRYTRTVPAGVDTTSLQTVILGERVDMSYFEYVVTMTLNEATRTAASTVATSVLQAPTPAESDSLSARMSVTFLYGIDNAFTGKMIEAATGRTTTNVPINLTDTSYDDVYGRLGLIKVGVGYMMTPRMEAVANFVYSNSSASFEATQIGTAGASQQVPLNVHFTNYRYVGVDVGQRFSFPQGTNRVVPFAGWIVGLNRNQDIRGTFVGVPLASTPGLAAQDGKFFERSWAFSLGPTGGVTIKAGPVDVIGETGLRFLGGLSDVDWLVEEGLRDINSKSERWSVPFLAGVRFRFK